MNEVKHTCCAPIYSSGSYRSYRCDKGAKYEHEGDWYCKTHHPPTVKARSDASYSKWMAELQAQRAEERAAEDAAAEQKRRADAYDRLIAINAELQSALMGALHCVREEKHPFRHWHLHAAEVLERAQQNQEASHG